MNRAVRPFTSSLSAASGISTKLPAKGGIPGAADGYITAMLYDFAALGRPRGIGSARKPSVRTPHWAERSRRLGPQGRGLRAYPQFHPR